MNTKVIICNWNDPKSISRAEKQKTTLENLGYTQSSCINGFNITKLIYQTK
jgi:hypothetical protein